MKTCVLYLVALLSASCLLSCKDPAGPEDEDLNPDKPNSNNLIISQKLHGSPGGTTYFSRIEPDGSSRVAFHGWIDDLDGVGYLDQAGDLLGFSRTGHDLLDHHSLPSTSVVPNGIITVGFQYTDLAEEHAVGYVTLLAADGTPLSQAIFSDPAVDMIWFSSVALTSDSTAILLGATIALDQRHPFLASITLTPAGGIEKRGEVILTSMPDRHVSDVAYDPSAGGDPVIFAVTRPCGSSCDIRTLSVHKISIPNGDLDVLSVDWSQEVVVNGGSGTYACNGDILSLLDGNLYVAGWTDDLGKSPVPSNGGSWDSGFVASYTTAGTERWATRVALTGHSDVYYSVLPTSSGLYAVGYAGAFNFTDTNETFGNALLSKFDPASGDLIFHRTFGSDRYRSAFSDVVITGDIAGIVGWTRQESGGGGYQGWFAEIDVSGGSATQAQALRTERAPLTRTAAEPLAVERRDP